MIQPPRTRGHGRLISLLLSRLLSIAADYFDLIGLNIVLIIKLEVDILDQERPDFITESVGIQVALQLPGISKD